MNLVLIGGRCRQRNVLDSIENGQQIHFSDVVVDNFDVVVIFVVVIFVVAIFVVAIFVVVFDVAVLI
jgi:hypothetical protein